jgi:asparagine synthase (glutamine-hydrolysing)
MTAFAGIICRDGASVPASWIRALGRCAGPAQGTIRAFPDQSAAFVEARTTFHPGAIQYAGEPRLPNSPNHPLTLADARIDNRDELMERLGLSAMDDADADAAVIAGACARWGERAADRLLGEFAVAHWDGARLLLFRDQLGLRAVYYFCSDTLFAFATDLRALLALPCVPRGLDDTMLADYLRGDGSGEPGRTFYEHLRVVPAGHTMTIGPGSVGRRRYWRPLQGPAVVRPDDAGYVEEMRARLVAAVECRLRDSVSPAVHLSGGIDSSTVACIAARYLRTQGRRLTALCSVLPAGYQGPESDERPFVEAVLAQEDNIDPVWVEPPVTADLFGAVEQWFDTLAEPPYSNATNIEAMLGEAGRARRIDVVLTGIGGDFFASWHGPNTIREIARSRRWALAFREIRALHREQGMRWRHLITREVVAPLVAAALPDGRRRRNPWTSVHPELARRVDERRGRPAQWAARDISRTSPREMMAFVIAPGHLEQPLSHTRQVFADRFAQALRFPLLDQRIVEFMLGVPPDQLLKDGWTRSLMRRAMAGILPEAIRLRRDKGAPFDPAVTSRIVAGRAQLREWAAATSGRACWQYVDRERFLEELSAVQRSPPWGWRPQTFPVVVMGGRIAKFVEWHQRAEERRCS